MEAFRSMSEDERQRVRLAFEKAWQNPEVLAARERYMKANDEYRLTLQKAIAAADPGVPELIERNRPKGPPGMMLMPDVNDPEFAKKAVMRLGMELHALARAENRKWPTKEVHARLQDRPEVKEAIGRLQQAGPAERLDAWRKLVAVFQGAARMELPVEDGGRRPGPPGGPRPGGEGPPPAREGAPDGEAGRNRPDPGSLPPR